MPARREIASDDDLPFSIDEWSADGRLLGVIARVRNGLIALATYKAAIQAYPQSFICLRNGARIVQEWRPG